MSERLELAGGARRKVSFIFWGLWVSLNFISVPSIKQKIWISATLNCIIECLDMNYPNKVLQSYVLHYSSESAVLQGFSLSWRTTENNSGKEEEFMAWLIFGEKPEFKSKIEDRHQNPNVFKASCRNMTSFVTVILHTSLFSATVSSYWCQILVTS